MCFPKFRELSNVSPNRSTVSSSGSATPSANNDSLTLGFRERTRALLDDDLLVLLGSYDAFVLLGSVFLILFVSGGHNAFQRSTLMNT